MPFYLKNFIVYKSSAGSGKTFTLVKEYLKLALYNKNNLTNGYKSILAITFTNKAASEMKWRIIKGLKELGTGSNAMLCELISKELDIDSIELKERASVVLTNILHNYSDFSIGTIDSFTHRIIRTFAIDLKLPVNFQIETDVDTVFKKVISILINNLGKDKLITDYLVQYSLAQVVDNKNWDPETTLIDFLKEINKEGITDLIRLLNKYQIADFEIIRKQLKVFIDTYELFLKTKGNHGLQLIREKGIGIEALAGGRSGICNLFVKLSEIKETSEVELFKSTVLKTLEEGKWYSAKAGAADKIAIDSIKHSLESLAFDTREFIRKNYQRYTVFKLVNENIHAMGLINELVKLTTQYKADENILFISEFNERISSVVNNEPTPFVFERLGDKYKHFLLDEFQDTSALQWQNMLPLIDNSLGNGNLNLIVGDGKQSIYRWRNANVEQFVNLPNIMDANNQNELMLERENSLVRNFEENILNKNYRSESVIVKFNNGLFDYLSETVLHETLKKIYFKQTQEHKTGDSGFVSMDFPDLTNDNGDEINMRFILKYVYQGIEDGYNYNDICIIVRQNNHGNTVANYLISHGIPVVSSDSLLLNNSTEINVLTAFLKYLVNQRDLISASVVINYLYDKKLFSEEQYVAFLRELNISKTKTLFTILNECNLKIEMIKFTSFNLFDSCREIIHLLGLNESNMQYIRFFLDEVLSFLQNNTSNISLFLDWWEKRAQKSSVIIPEGINAINIMTIHASKGLEFPVVITPYIAWNVEKKQSIWVTVNEEDLNLPVALIGTAKATDDTIYKPFAEKEREQQTLDSLNMLYVDFTRAVDRLHIISPALKKDTKKNTHTWLYEFAKSNSEFNDAEQCLCFGKLSKKSLALIHKPGLEQLSVNTLAFGQNEEVIKIKGASTYNFNEDVSKAREYGILIHYILSQIKIKSDVDKVIYNTFLSGDISKSEAEKITGDIKQILSLEKISRFFEPGVEVKNELEILTKEGEILRPDRVVVSGTEAVVIDYKTGKKNTSKYHNQMKDYEQALLSLGYTSVTKILLYIYEKDIEILL